MRLGSGWSSMGMCSCCLLDAAFNFIFHSCVKSSTEDMTSKLKGSRLEAEVDRCRSECSWKRLGEILPAVRAKNSGMEHLGDLLEAELILETFVEKHCDYLEPKKANAEELQKAETLLNNVIVVDGTDRAPIQLEANLLLAKLHYYCADFAVVIKDVERSRLEQGDTPFVTLRALRLVAEAYAVKGFSLEATMRKQSKSQVEKYRMRALFCFEKSAELAISYVQELEKSLNARPSTSSLISTTLSASSNGKQNCDKMGDLLESTLERVPLLRLRRNLCDEPWDLEGVEWYRRIMTSLGDKLVGEKLQQRLSRQLAEVLIRGMPDSDHMASQSVSSKSQSLGFYTGSHKTYFSPSCRMEEILLLLLISEVLATKDVVLSRAEEDTASRRQSVQTAKSVYNLLTLVLVTLRQYELLASIYERAMKFANEDRYLWFQFALTLLCHGRWVRASRILSQCIAFERRDESAAVEHMLAAQIEIEQLGQYDEAISHAEKAVELCEGNWLTARCSLLHAIAYSLKAENVVRYASRVEMYADSIKMFEKAAALDPHDDLTHYYCARQYAIVRNMESAREWCERTLELNAEMPSALMLLALVFTAHKDYKAAMELVVDSLAHFPSYFPLLVLRLKLEVKFGRVEEALATSHHLLQFWKRPDLCYHVDATSHISQFVNDSVQREVRSSVARSMSSRDTMGPVVPMLAAPLGVFPPSPLASSIAQGTSAVDLTEGSTVFAVTSVSEMGANASSVSEGIASSSNAARTVYGRFNAQANIWLELAELFLELDRVNEVRPCVEEACALFPNSHQALYLKGRLLAMRAERSSDTSVRDRMLTEAKASLLGALAIAPAHLSSLRHLADIYRAEGNVRMAEKMLKDVVRIEPLHSDSWQLLGMVLAEDDRYEESLECFETASTLDTSTPLIPFTAIPVLVRSSC